MNRLKYLIVTLVSALTLFSCTDMLELEPEVAATHYSYWKSEKDVRSSFYTALLLSKAAYSNIPALQAQRRGILTDVERSYDDFRIAYRWDVESINLLARKGLSNFSWGHYYQIIGACNDVLDNIDKPEMTEDRRNFWKGQALFLKAYTYFQLVRYYDDVVVVKSMKDKGELPRTEWREVINYSIELSEEARKLLVPFADLTDMDGKSITNKHFAGREAANMLLGHLYAWKVGYGNEINNVDDLQKAISFLTSVIDGDKELGDESSSMALVSTSEICTSVMLGNSIESIYEINGEVDGSNTTWERKNFNLASSAMMFPYYNWLEFPQDYNVLGVALRKQTVQNMYADDDLRRQEYFYEFDARVSDMSAYALPNKLRDPSFIVHAAGYKELRRFYGCHPIFRLAGTYLLRAECYAKVGDDGKAIADLNLVRGRSFAKAYDAAVDGDLLNAIFSEREKELLWEGHRFFDIKRNHLYKEKLPGCENYTEQDIIDGALSLPLGYGAFIDNSKMRQKAFWNINLKTR